MWGELFDCKKVFILTLLFSLTLAAEKQFSGYHMRMGLVSGSFSGAYTGSFSEPLTLEGQLSLVHSAKTSNIIKGTFSYNPKDSELKYMHMGLGQRYYYNSRVKDIFAAHEGSSITIKSGHNFFGGWDLGVSQMHLVTITKPVSVSVTMLEYGAAIGYTYKITDLLGLEVIAALSMGLPISSVEVENTVMRFMVGLSYF